MYSSIIHSFIHSFGHSICWYFSLQFPTGKFYCHPCVPKKYVHPNCIIIHVVLIEYFGIHPWGRSKLTVYKSSLSHAPIFIFLIIRVLHRIDWYLGASIHPSNSSIHPRRVQLPVNNLTAGGTLPQGQERGRKSRNWGAAWPTPERAGVWSLLRYLFCHGDRQCGDRGGKKTTTKQKKNNNNNKQRTTTKTKKTKWVSRKLNIFSVIDRPIVRS